MARQSAFTVKVDVTQLTAYSDFLNTLTPEALAARWVTAINSTVDDTYDLARRTILAGINLTDSYVQRKMVVTHATNDKPQASILASAGRSNLTSLSHYGAMQLTERVNFTNAEIQAKRKKFGRWPGWTRRIGNAGLGIAPDLKAAGKTVEVVKGARKKMGPIFSIPGKKDNEGNPILFRNIGAGNGKKGKVEALTGPSVYQLFRVAIPKITDETAEELEQAVLFEANRIFGGTR